LIGKKEVSVSNDGNTKLGEIAEFMWNEPENTTQVVVSFWENNLKNELLALFKAEIEHGKIDNQFVK
jgi:hypothetical protein